MKTKNKPKNTYLVTIKLDKTKRNICATVSEVLTHDFISVFSIAKQENIQFRDLLKINSENYFLENLNPIKIYEAKLDKLENEDYLKRRKELHSINKLTNSIENWEENGKNKIKLYEKNLGSGDDHGYTYSIIKESKFQEKNISSFLFSDKSEFNDMRANVRKIFVNEDDDFKYFSKIIYAEDLSPHLILNFGSYINIWANKDIRMMTPQERLNYKERKKISEIVEEEYGFRWDVDDEYDLKYFIDIIIEFNLQDRINENSYNKWLHYKNLIGLEDWEFYKFFDFRDFILFFLAEYENLEKIIKSPHYCTKKRQCQFCHSMTHKDFDVCYHCNYNEKLNIFNKINENLKSTHINLYHTLIIKNKELNNIYEKIKYFETRRSYEYKKTQKWYKLNRLNEEKFNNKSEDQKQINSLKHKIDLIKKLIVSVTNLLQKSDDLKYLNMDFKEIKFV